MIHDIFCSKRSVFWENSNLKRNFALEYFNKSNVPNRRAIFQETRRMNYITKDSISVFSIIFFRFAVYFGDKKCNWTNDKLNKSWPIDW